MGTMVGQFFQSSKIRLDEYLEIREQTCQKFTVVKFR